ncbi:MAG: c-type cytochrome [Gallionella sp.]
MIRFAIATFTLLAMAMVSVAHADPKSLAMEKQCFACHTLSMNQIVATQISKAPDFKTIAEKYRGQASAEASLITTIKSGGVDHWGSTPMPSSEGNRPNVSDAEAKELADWILEQH